MYCAEGRFGRKLDVTWIPVSFHEIRESSSRLECWSHSDQQSAQDIWQPQFNDLKTTPNSLIPCPSIVSTFTYLLTPWCRVLEKLTGLQLVKKFPAYYGNRIFITALTSVRHLGQPNPVHITTSHLLEIHHNIIHPSTPRSPQWSLSLRFPQQDHLRTPLLTHTCHMPSPSHLMKTTTDWKLPLFSASVKEEILAVLCTFPIVWDQAYLGDQQSRNWFL